MIRPYLHWVTVEKVDHEDHVEKLGEPEVQHLGPLSIMALGPRERKQGIGAGVVIEVGEHVDGQLEPGAKIYFAEAHALVIGDIRVVQAHAIVAWEAP